VSTGRKKSTLVERYGLPESHIFDSGCADFAAGLLRATSDRGVDVVLNTRSNRFIRESHSCVAEFGCFLDLATGDEGPGLATPLLQRNAIIAKIDFDQMIRSRPESAQRVFRKVIELAYLGIFGAVSPKLSYSIVDLDKALALMRGNLHCGKVLIHCNDQSEVMMVPSKPARLQLSPEGTYVLAGGLGSLGLDIAELLFQHGAGHVVFLSRTGGSIDSQERLAAFQRQGHRAEHFKCDITSAADVRNVSDTLATNRCSIKGVIQCAMVLEDGIFETMPFAQWQRATKPKIQGTRNLHDGLTKDLDFFITLSSIVCVIGNAAQANYAAGNTFEDAFAYWRRSQGLAGTTINVGIVSDSAHFIGENDISSYVEKYAHLANLLTNKDELLVTLRAAMQGSTVDGSAAPPQVVLGLGSGLSRKGPMADTWTKDRKFELLVSSSDGISSPGTEVDL
jgi:NAD(P)-dependent dehydrogenase (short-subunit alcohol dehydrogenase family)